MIFFFCCLHAHYQWLETIVNYTAVESPLTATVFTTATFVADGLYIDSCLNLFTTATFFCQQGGSWGEVQLHVNK